MTEVIFLPVIAIVVLLCVLHQKVKNLTHENDQLRSKMNILWTAYQKNLSKEEASSQEPPTPARPYGQGAIPNPQAYSGGQPTPAPPYAQRPNPNPQAYPGGQPMPAPPYAQRPIQNPPPYSGEQRSYPPPYAQGQYTPHPAAATKPEKDHRNPGKIENWFGRNVLGIAASVLFFVGLIVFAVWIYSSIPETVKIILMYLISAGITAAGILLTKKHRNHFTLILSGCGCGLLFISVLLTYLYFGCLNGMATFALLLIWLAAVLSLAWYLKSTLISLVAHIGMGVYLCFAYYWGISDDKLVILLVYQAISIAMIVVGNTLCRQKTYHFGLFLSMIMTLVANAFLYARFIGSSPLSEGAFPLTSLPDAGVALTFFAQFIFASFLSYLLTVSTARFQDSGVLLVIHIANKLLWTAALCGTLLPVVLRLGYAYSEGVAAQEHFALGIMTATGIIFLLIHGLLSIFLSTKQAFIKLLETVSVLWTGALTAILLLRLWFDGMTGGALPPRLPLLLLPAVLLLWAGLRRKNFAYCLAGNLLLGLEWILMAVFGFHELTRFGTVALPLLYLALYTCLVWMQWLLEPPEKREQHSWAFRLFTYLFLQVTVCIILAGSGYENSLAALLIVLTIFNLLLLIIRYDRGNHQALNTCMRIVEGLLLAFNGGMIAFMPKRDTTDIVLCAVLAVLSVFYAFYRTPIVLGQSGKEDICTGFKFTLLALAVIQGFTGWFDRGYVLTLVAMASLLPCLAVGHVRKASGLVRYSFIASILVAGKLILVDVLLEEPLSRLIALFCGSILFLIIYLGYDRFYREKMARLLIFMRLSQLLILGASALVIAYSPHTGTAATVISILLTLLSFVWAFLWTPKTLGSSGGWVSMLEGIKLTLLVLAAVQGYTDWFLNAYILSLFCMLTALVCVVAGLVWRIGSLRMYGLVLTMVCVLKLVTWDVAELETLLRILSLIGGGMICFAISALYSYSVKHISASGQGDIDK